MLTWTILEEQFPVRNVAASIIGNGVIWLLWQLRYYCNHDHDKFSSLIQLWWQCLWCRSLCSKKIHRYWPWKPVSSHFHLLVRPMLLHCMALVSVRLFCKNLGNLQEFFGQMVYRPLWQKIARTPMIIKHYLSVNSTAKVPEIYAWISTSTQNRLYFRCSLGSGRAHFPNSG